MKIMRMIGGAMLLACLPGALGVARAQEPAAAAQDTSRWRFLIAAGGNGVLISDEVAGNEIRTLSTYLVFAQPRSGVDGLLTRYEVNCETERLKDLGSVAYAGTEARGNVASQTGGQPIQIESGTLFEAISTYACTRRLPTSDRRIVTGRAAAVEYARTRMRR